MCPRLGYLPPSPELLTVRPYCFGTVKASSTCFLKKASFSTHKLQPWTWPAFCQWMQFAHGVGDRECTRKLNGISIFSKTNPWGRISNACSIELAHRKWPFLVQGSLKEQQSYEQFSYQPHDAGIISPHFTDEEMEFQQRPSYCWQLTEPKT